MTGTKHSQPGKVWIKIQVPAEQADQLTVLARRNLRTRPAELKLALENHLKAAA